MILWLNKAINEKEQKVIPSMGSHLNQPFAPRTDHMASISSIKSTPTQYYGTYQPGKYASKPYVPGNYASGANSQYSGQKYGTTYGGLSTDKKGISPIADEIPEQAAGTQLLNKNFSVTSISSGSVPYTTTRMNQAEPMKTYGIGGKNLAEDLDIKEKEPDKAEKSADTNPEAVPEPRPVPNILPIKYTQPS